MASNDTTPGGYYPPAGFHFRVQFNGIDDDNEMRFQSVTGLSAEIEMETYKGGGINTYVYQVPVRVKFSDVTLKRGILVGSKAITWVLGALNQFDFSPKNLTIMLMNEKNSPLMTWQLNSCLPKKWSVSEFNAEQSSIAIEELVLVVRDFEIKQSQ